MTALELLDDFYAAYFKWLENGAVEIDCTGFMRFTGLCSNLNEYAYMEGYSFNLREGAKEIMRYQFETMGLNKDYPFDSKDSYELGYVNRDMHLNPQRIAWVKDRVKEIE